MCTLYQSIIFAAQNNRYIRKIYTKKTYNMKRHLGYPVAAFTFSRLACVRSPFTKGIGMGLQAFHQLYIEHPERCCKKCVVIYQQYLNNTKNTTL